jgi:GNAT superfamily N-acetyltransferase
MRREDLVPEVENALDDYSFAWEGAAEEVAELHDALARLLPETVRGSDGWVVRIRFPPTRVDERTREVMDRFGARDRNLVWFVEPSSPPGLERTLIAQGLKRSTEWHGMMLTDLSISIPTNAHVRAEELSEANAEEYAVLRAMLDPGPNALDRHRGATQRYLAMPQRSLQIFLPRVTGNLVGVASLVIRSGGVAYLREAETLPEYRGRGVYRTMVAHRLAVARATGCTGAVVQAVTDTSAPVLTRLGFEAVGRFAAYTASPKAAS